MNSIYSQLETLFVNKGTLPIPENARSIDLSGTTIAYQGYAAKDTLSSIKMTK